MPLPKVATPTYELKLISNGKTIKYRPFLVKEEKVLIIALESQNQKDITTAIKQTLQNCVLTRGVKIDTLPSFDLENLFLNIRSKSVGETVDVLVTCQDDGETKVEHTVSIADVYVEVPDDHTDTIEVSEGVHMKMKYPSLQEFIDNNFDMSSADGKDTVDKTFKIIASCIDTIYTDDEAWSSSDCTEKELISWLETLDSSQFKKVEQFFNTLPKLMYKSTVINPKTGNENEVVIEGLTNFFM
jgi:hypothetical protein